MSENEHMTAPSAAPERPGTLRKTVVMVGMMGAGKTAVGKALAARLGVPFLDSDAEIETAANMTIPEIFDFTLNSTRGSILPIATAFSVIAPVVTSTSFNPSPSPFRPDSHA